MRKILTCLFLAGALAQAAPPQPFGLFTDHAVLQREVPVPIWGAAEPGETITVRYGGQSVRGTADGAGRWRVNLAPMSAHPPAELLIEGRETFRAQDVAVGEVWLVSGQSNMEWPVEKADGAEDFVKAAATQSWLREVKLPRRVSPKLETSTGAAAWVPASPQTVNKFSAVAYQFARQLPRPAGMAVGIVNASLGGTYLESWMSPEAIAASRNAEAIRARWAKTEAEYPALKVRYEAESPGWLERKKAAVAAGLPFTEKGPAAPIGPEHDSRPSSLWHGILGPLAGFPAAGFVWYQGESNVGRPEEYADSLTCFLRDVRNKWKAKEMPCLVVQLPLFKERKYGHQPWPQIRLAQELATEAVGKAWVAVTVDLGEVASKHPTNKTEVGRRLALLARRHVYGEQMAGDSPSLARLTRHGSEVEVRFETEGAELELRAPAKLDPEQSVSFELAGGDGEFHPASAVLDGQSVRLRSAEVAAPAQVRYLFHNTPKVVLFTKDGLPASPFWKAIP